MKSTSFLVALIGSSAVSALEPLLADPVMITSEVTTTRTVTVTTFQEAVPTNGRFLVDRGVHRSKGSGPEGPQRGRPAASPLEKMPSLHGAAHEVAEPTNRPLFARAPMPTVVIPPPQSFAKEGQSAAGNATQGSPAPTGHRPGHKVHNGTLNLIHVTNHTASDGKGSPSEKTGNVEAWLKKLEETASKEAKVLEAAALPTVEESEESAILKVKELLNEVRAADTEPAN